VRHLEAAAVRRGKVIDASVHGDVPRHPSSRCVLMDPFQTYSLRDVFADRLSKIDASIDLFSDDQMLANDLEVLALNLCESHRIDPVEIYDGERSKPDIKKCKIQYNTPNPRFWGCDGPVVLDGISLTFTFPYGGSQFLFQCNGSTHSYGPFPQLDFIGSTFRITYQFEVDEASKPEWRDILDKKVSDDIARLKRELGYINEDVRRDNSQLKSTILRKLEERRRKSALFFDVVKQFDIPLYKGDCVNRLVEVHKRMVPISDVYKPQSVNYSISDQMYLDILSTIKSAASTMETTPDSYARMDEEDLRNVLLVALNSVYHGQANGEAFRNQGKTDICIKAENNAAYIAECKVWKGEKKVIDALKQLDSYATWRDCKTSLIYFVIKKDFIAIVDKMKAALASVPEVRNVVAKDRNEFDCSLMSWQTPGQRMRVDVLLLNLYSGQCDKMSVASECQHEV